MQALGAGAVAVLLLLTPVWQTIALRGSPKSDPEPLRELGKALPEKRYVVTDVLWAVAWYGQRPATWIPQQATQLAAIAQAEPVSSVYLSPALPSYPPEENAAEWQRIYQQVSDLPGYNKVPRPKARDVIYVKMPTLAEAGQAVKAKPTDVGAQLQLGEAQLASGEPRVALATSLAAQRLKPGAFEPYQAAGEASLKLKDYKGASNYLQQALKLTPRDQKTLLRLADVANTTGNTAQAIDLYERVLADAPDQPVAVNNLAFFYTQTNHYPYRALEMAKRAVMQDPGNGPKWDTLGWASYRAGRVREGAAQLQQALKLAPHEATIQTHLKAVLQATAHKH